MGIYAIISEIFIETITCMHAYIAKHNVGKQRHAHNVGKHNDQHTMKQQIIPETSTRESERSKQPKTPKSLLATTLCRIYTPINTHFRNRTCKFKRVIIRR